MNQIKRPLGLGYEHDRRQWRIQGEYGVPEKRKLLRGAEPQRSDELFERNEKTISGVSWRSRVAVKIVSDEQERPTILGTARGGEAEDVGGSNPFTPTKNKSKPFGFGLLFI